MSIKAEAIKAYRQNHSINQTAGLIMRLLGKDTPKDDSGHWYKTEGAPCPHDKPHKSDNYKRNRLQLYPKRSKINGEKYERETKVARAGKTKGFNAEVIDPITKEKYHFAPGTKVTEIRTFAGYGSNKPLKPEVVEGLCQELGGDSKKWAHRSGEAVLEETAAEVHWFQEETVGKVKFKVKRWKDES